MVSGMGTDNCIKVKAGVNGSMCPIDLEE